MNPVLLLIEDADAVARNALLIWHRLALCSLACADVMWRGWLAELGAAS